MKFISSHVAVPERVTCQYCERTFSSRKSMEHHQRNSCLKRSFEKDKSSKSSKPKSRSPDRSRSKSSSTSSSAGINIYGPDGAILPEILKKVNDYQQSEKRKEKSRSSSKTSSSESARKDKKKKDVLPPVTVVTPMLDIGDESDVQVVDPEESRPAIHPAPLKPVEPAVDVRAPEETVLPAIADAAPEVSVPPPSTDDVEMTKTGAVSVQDPMDSAPLFASPVRTPKSPAIDLSLVLGPPVDPPADDVLPPTPPPVCQPAVPEVLKVAIPSISQPYIIVPPEEIPLLKSPTLPVSVALPHVPQASSTPDAPEELTTKYRYCSPSYHGSEEDEDSLEYVPRKIMRPSVPAEPPRVVRKTKSVTSSSTKPNLPHRPLPIPPAGPTHVPRTPTTPSSIQSSTNLFDQHMPVRFSRVTKTKGSTVTVTEVWEYQ